MTVEAPSESRLAAARADLATPPVIQAARPAPGERSTRAAYLELLKLSLCDLVGGRTASVGWTKTGLVFSRELAGEERNLRSVGMDWPAYGLTMVGLKRLDDLQACVESVIRDAVPGGLIEAGAWRGGASILMRAVLDSLGATDRTVWVADSFQGFPGVDGVELARDDLSTFDLLAVPLPEVRANFERLGLEEGVEFVPGFFEDTLPGLVGRPWSLIRLDADTYDATQLALRCLYPGLAAGGYLIVDDYGALEECATAVEDFRSEHGITEPIERVDWTCMRWRRQDDRALPGPSIPESPRKRVTPPPRPERGHIPTVQELRLREEVEQLRTQIAAAQSQLDSSAGLLRRVRARVRRRLR